MKYPRINKQPRREVNVPRLSGGINLRDGLTGVRDNQMTDCVNMWYKDGGLRTRPAFVTNEDMYITNSRAYEDIYIADLKTHSSVKNGEAVLVSCIECDGDFEDGTWLANIGFYWQNQDKTIQAGYIEFDGLREFNCKNSSELENAIDKSSRLIFEKDGYVYLFLNENGNFRAYKSQIADELSWDYISSDGYYIPTVMSHCQRTGIYDYKGVQFEGYNLLTNRYKMIYSAYNESDTISTHPMRYGFIEEIAAKGIIRATIAYIDENEKPQICVHEADASGLADSDWVYEADINDDGLKMYVCKKYLGFSSGTVAGEMPAKTLNTEEDKKKFALIEDNITIEVNVAQDEEQTAKMMRKFFNMTKSIWFGGAANGINGGSRLFLCGNTDENEKALIVWSGLNNPLYFPENNYAYVGDKSQGVTAFGQQGENLVIFKEKSIYYSYYATNDSITADDLINQSVVDYEANSVYFPIIQLNAGIGCDCPGTVQLCRNRLVWANSDGNVYTLFSNNQYSERTIYKVSDMISLALSKENDLKNAVSCDFEGHYLLGVGNKIYAMDYNCYGYQYASSYSKTEDSNALIPWYVWEFDNTIYAGKIFEIDNKLMRINSFQTDDGITLTFATLSVNNENGCDMVLCCYSTGSTYIYENKINSKIQTKLFDFSAAGYLKNVDRVSIGFGNNGGEPINVSFVTDKGCESETVTLDGSATDERDAAFVTVKNFYPCMRALRTFGVKVESEGPLVVDGVSMQYRLLGGVK